MLESATPFQGFEDGGSIVESSWTASPSSDCASCAYVMPWLAVRMPPELRVTVGLSSMGEKKRACGQGV